MSVARTAAALALSVLLAAVGASSAPAIVGGHVVSRSAYPWFVVLSDNCAAVLVRPSRLVTSANCINEDLIAPGDRVHIAHVRRRVTAIADHPGWVRNETTYTDTCQLRRGCLYNGDLVGVYCRIDMVCPDDLALIALDQPVRGVALPRPARPYPGLRATALGVGLTYNADDPDTAQDDGRLRAAELGLIADRACAARYRRAGSSWLQTFDVQSMFCGLDPSPPRTAALCVADWGGPLAGRGPTGWRLYGIASWDKDCGEGGWPSVFSDVWRYRSFVLARHPTWLPAMTGYPRITGTPAVGQTLTCQPPKMSASADQTIFTFFADGDEQDVRQRGASPAYVALDSDRGRTVGCRVEARNSGGIGVASTFTEHGVEIHA